MTLTGELEVDGKKHRFDGSSITLQVGTARNESDASAQMGTQVKETISISGGKLTTTVTTTSADGKTTTTTTIVTPVDDPE
jgi:hypothetical protein